MSSPFAGSLSGPLVIPSPSGINFTPRSAPLYGPQGGILPHQQATEDIRLPIHPTNSNYLIDNYWHRATSVMGNNLIIEFPHGNATNLNQIFEIFTYLNLDPSDNAFSMSITKIKLPTATRHLRHGNGPTATITSYDKVTKPVEIKTSFTVPLADYEINDQLHAFANMVFDTMKNALLRDFAVAFYQHMLSIGSIPKQHMPMGGQFTSLRDIFSGIIESFGCIQKDPVRWLARIERDCNKRNHERNFRPIGCIILTDAATEFVPLHTDVIKNTNLGIATGDEITQGYPSGTMKHVAQLSIGASNQHSILSQSFNMGTFDIQPREGGVWKGYYRYFESTQRKEWTDASTVVKNAADYYGDVTSTDHAAIAALTVGAPILGYTTLAAATAVATANDSNDITRAFKSATGSTGELPRGYKDRVNGLFFRESGAVIAGDLANPDLVGFEQGREPTEPPIQTRTAIGSAVNYVGDISNRFLREETLFRLFTDLQVVNGFDISQAFMHFKKDDALHRFDLDADAAVPRFGRTDARVFKGSRINIVGNNGTPVVYTSNAYVALIKAFALAAIPFAGTAYLKFIVSKLTAAKNVASAILVVGAGAALVGYTGTAGGDVEAGDVSDAKNALAAIAQLEEMANAPLSKVPHRYVVECAINAYRMLQISKANANMLVQYGYPLWYRVGVISPDILYTGHAIIATPTGPEAGVIGLTKVTQYGGQDVASHTFTSHFHAKGGICVFEESEVHTKSLALVTGTLRNDIKNFKAYDDSKKGEHFPVREPTGHKTENGGLVAFFHPWDEIDAPNEPVSIFAKFFCPKSFVVDDSQVKENSELALPFSLHIMAASRSSVNQISKNAKAQPFISQPNTQVPPKITPQGILFPGTAHHHFLNSDSCIVVEGMLWGKEFDDKLANKRRIAEFNRASVY